MWTFALFKFVLKQKGDVALVGDGWLFFALKSFIFTAYGREGVKMNFIDRIFIGELTSTVMCEECTNVGIL